jgi:hypothetical protein
MNESSPTVLACLFLAALVAVESPGRALDLLTETQMRVTTYTRQMHAPLALLRRALFFLFFSTTQLSVNRLKSRRCWSETIAMR